MGTPGPLMFLQLLIVYGIPLMLIVWLVRRVRQSSAEHQEILQRLGRLESKLDQRPPAS
jgi:flagellar biogenesis protein FliO